MAKAGSERQKRVAVVGSGMAGLVIAHLLHRDPKSQYQVTVFESNSQPALDGSSVSIEGSPQRVDVPMRVFAGGYYKNLKAMYDWMGVQYHAQKFLYCFSALTSPCAAEQNGPPAPLKDRSVHFIHSSNNHRMPPLRPPHLGLLTFAAEVLYLLFWYFWFTVCCYAVEDHPQEAFGDYIERIHLPRRFIMRYLFPVISSVATCSNEELGRFPASDVINYKVLTTYQSHFVLSQGMQQVQRRLMEGLDVKLETRVSEITPSGSGISVAFENKHFGRVIEEFDKVVLAVPPDAVGQIAPRFSAEMLKIPTTSVQTAVYAINPSKKEPGEDDGTVADEDFDGSQIIHLRTSDSSQYTEAVHFQSSDVCVVTNPLTKGATRSATHSSTFTRVLRSVESKQIVNQHLTLSNPARASYETKNPWRNGDDGIWIAGGWVWDGMVLLEGCIVSAMRVADGLGVEVPWRR